MQQIKTDILIPAAELSAIEEYVKSELTKKEKHVFSNVYGYIEEIMSIDSICFSSFFLQDNKGSMVFTVTFTAKCIHISIGDIIQSEITQTDNILYSANGPLDIIMTNESERTKVGDIVYIKILCVQVDIANDIIRGVGFHYHAEDVVLLRDGKYRIRAEYDYNPKEVDPLWVNKTFFKRDGYFVNRLRYGDNPLTEKELQKVSSIIVSFLDPHQ